MTGGIDVRIVPEPDNPYNKGEDIAQRVDLLGEELGELSQAFGGADIGYIPLKGHVIALGGDITRRAHYNGTEVNFAFRNLSLAGSLVEVTGNSDVVYGAVIEVWVE